MNISNHAKGVLITLLGVIVITPDTVLIRLVSADQWTNLFWRGALSGLAILIVSGLIYRKSFPQQVRSMGKPGVWFTIAFTASAVLFLLAVKHTTVANVLFIISISPLFSALISRFLLKNVIHSRTWWAIGFTLVGISIIAWSSIQGNGGGGMWGDLAALATAISMAIGFTIAHQHSDIDLVPAMGFANLLSGMIALPLAVPLSIIASDVVWLGLMGLIVVPVSFSLLTIGPRYIPAPEVGLFMLLEAVIGPYWVWLVIDEHPGNMTIIGGVIIILTLAVMNIFALLQGRHQRA